MNKDEYNKDKKFSPKITSPAPENTQDLQFFVVVRIRMDAQLSFFLRLVSFTADSDPLRRGGVRVVSSTAAAEESEDKNAFDSASSTTHRFPSPS